MAFDQLLKQVVIDNVGRGEPVEVAFGVEITNVRNDGIAFGLLSGGEALVLAFTLGTLALLVLYFALHWSRPGLWLSVGLLCGGALGNLADRIRDGAVIDFFDLPLWPAFNAADVAVVAGVTLLALTVIESHNPDEARS